MSGKGLGATADRGGGRPGGLPVSAREGRGAVLPALGMRTRRRDEFARPGISGTLGVLAGWPWDDACGLPRVQSMAEHSSRHRT